MHPIIEFSQHSFDAFSIIISSLLMQTLRHRKAKTLAQSTTAGKGGRQVSDSESELKDTACDSGGWENQRECHLQDMSEIRKK